MRLPWGIHISEAVIVDVRPSKMWVRRVLLGRRPLTLLADIGDIKLIDKEHDVRITKPDCSQDLLVMLARLPLVEPAVSTGGI